MTTTKIGSKTKKSNIAENIYYTLFSAVVFAIIIIILCNPKKYNASIHQGLNLFFVSVLPGLLPFMFFSKILSGLPTIKTMSKRLSKPMQTLFGTSGISGYVFLLSILSGYPVGAKLVADMYEEGFATETDAKKMSVFCTTSGPIFVIGTVGSIMFGSAKIGIILYISHILASVMSGIVFRKNVHETQKIPDIKTSAPHDIITKSMYDTTTNILLVCGYITIFFLIADILCSMGVVGVMSAPLQLLFDKQSINLSAKGIILGLIEVTRGVKTLSANINVWSVCFACALISFGGLSILLQSMAFLKKCKIKARNFVFAKCVHAVFSFIICFVILKITSCF